MGSSQRQKIIGICGYKGSGKTTAAEILIKRYTNSKRGVDKYARHNFADPLKRMIHSLGIPMENLERGDMKESPLEVLGRHSARHAMQTLGTEWGRDCMGKDFWVNMWALRLPNFPNVIAADLRFMNEARKIKDLHGKIIRINRPGYLSAEHISEKGIYQITPDVVILNDGDMEAFELKVIAHVEGLFK